MDGEKKELGDYLFSWKRKFDNFWYHYKVAAIMGIFLLAFIIFCIAQCSGRKEGDANIAYIGATEIGGQHFENLQRALHETLGEDLNGDDEIFVDFTHFLYMTQAQAEDARAMNRAVDMQSVMTVQTQINLELAAGNIIIYLIDSEVYKEFSNRPDALFMPLEESLGFMPENAYDAYALRLGNLQCWEYYEGLNDFPASTIITVRNMQLAEEGKKDVRERYDRNLKMFRRLVDFTFLPEEQDPES